VAINGGQAFGGGEGALDQQAFAYDPSDPQFKQLALRQPLVASRSGGAQMGLFGLGAPELAVIAGIGLVVLGPDQLKKLAKDVGKVSAELKQVPEEFNKGMEIGKQELEAKKATPPELAAEEKSPKGETPA
jgi:sec-independent protein translocase protein TatA